MGYASKFDAVRQGALLLISPHLLQSKPLLANNQPETKA